MERLRKKLKTEFALAFPGSSVQFSRVPPGGKLSGRLLWEGFAGLDQLERQLKLHEVLVAALPPEDRRSLSMIFTFTPSELRMLKAG